MPSSFRTRVENAAGTVAFLTLLGAAVAFAVADQSSRVSTDLIEVQALEGAATDAALYRANLAIAVAATASSDRETVEAAVTGAHDALDRIAAEAPLASELAADIAVLRQSTDQMDQSLEAEDPVAATEVAVRTAGPALNRISSRLEAASAELRASIEAEHDEAGRAARLSSFSAALIAPALVLWSYRRSARRRLEHERLQAELQRTYDLGRAKDELIAGLSHQLRTPLTGIQGFSSAVLDQAKSGQLQP
ncbi:MAG: histidine kinase dimerization/phospho-acceptor domain-containing protein, partial [Acidimicrobiia bacterium]